LVARSGKGFVLTDARLDYSDHLMARVFAFTLRDIEPGSSRCRQTIVTTRGCIHGGTADAKSVPAFLDDRVGKEHLIH